MTPTPTVAALPAPSATALDGVPITSIPLGVDAYPLGVTSAFGSIWVAEHRHDRVRRLDPSTLQTIAEIGPISGPGWFAVTPDAVWVTNQTGVGMSRLDPLTNGIAAAVGDLPTCWAPAYALGSLWYAACDTDELVRIDPKTDSVIARVPAKGRGFPIAIDGALFVAGSAGLGRFDEASRRIVAVGGCCGMPIGFDGRTVWLYDAPKVVRVDPDSGKVAGRMSVPLLGGVAFRDGSAWLTVSTEGLRQVDLDSGKVVRTVPTGSTPLAITDAGGAFWVTDQLGDELWRVEP
jgi:DNA-binding beta-propeller fold protein YncE